MFAVCCAQVTTVDPDDPDPEPEYRIQLKVVYTRNTDNILYPGGSDGLTEIRYELYDPDAERYKDQYDIIVGNYRTGRVRLEKKAENYFIGYIEKVFVQGDASTHNHKAYIRDHKLHDGIGDASTYTTDGLVIFPDQNDDVDVIDISFFSYIMRFKLKKK